MPAIPSTQLPIDFEGQQYSGVYSVSGTLMITRIPGVGSKSVELEDLDDLNGAATQLLTGILENAKVEGRLA